MSLGYHDTLVYRLAHMLVKLNQGDQLDPEMTLDALLPSQFPSF